MIVIDIEGLDKSGKATQTSKLTERLRNAGFKVVQSEFHRYDTPTGALIRKWLKKEWDVDQQTIELVMAADKMAQQRWFRSLENRGFDFLILDRYTGSQEVYGVVSGDLAGYDTEIDGVKKWIDSLLQYCRKPDYTIFIDIAPEESMSRKGKHGENDRYEEDVLLLSLVREEYLERYKSDRTWMKVDGHLDPEMVHKLIWNMLSTRVYGLEGERLVKQ